ncbi:MAG TPA: hypothetical protein VMR37_00560, partial [Rhabdochlamydiaceae bacterium]|nr:hypothetical protein [Rhabdochlamydiaceae bacterium]
AAGIQFSSARRAGLSWMETAVYIGVSNLTTLVAFHYLKKSIKAHYEEGKEPIRFDAPKINEFQENRKRQFPRDTAIALLSSYVLGWAAGSLASSLIDFRKFVPLPMGSTFVMNGTAFLTHALLLLASKNLEQA